MAGNGHWQLKDNLNLSVSENYWGGWSWGGSARGRKGTMIDREKYEETKKILSQIQHTLEMEPLAANNERNCKYSRLKQLVCFLGVPWLPMSWS